LTILDYIALGGAAVLLVIGLFKGLLKQFLGLFVYGGAFLLTAVLYKLPMVWMVSLIPDDNTRPFVVLAVVLKLLSLLIVKLFTSVKAIKVIDKILGGLIGFFIVYAAFGILVAMVADTTEGFAIVKAVFKTPIESTWLAQKVYASNPVGDWLIGLITTPAA